MNKINQADFAELFEVYKIALVNRWLTKKEIVKWADHIITTDSDPDLILFEISLSEHKDINHIISVLNEYIGQKKATLFGRVILGLLYEMYIEQDISLSDVVGTLYQIKETAGITINENRFIYGLIEDYDCAVDGIIGTIKEVEENIFQFLEIYGDFKIENYNDWKTIDSTINGNIRFLLETVKRKNK